MQATGQRHIKEGRDRGPGNLDLGRGSEPGKRARDDKEQE